MSLPERSLYLYFLDRELGDAVGYQLRPEIARNVARTLTVATTSRLICGLSLLYENDNIDRETVRFFGDLVAAGVLDTISHQLSYEEFKATRMVMYAHDAARYPAYFGKTNLPEIEPIVQKTRGTTARIVSGMTEWALQIPDLDSRYRITSTQLRDPVLHAIREREERAVTFSLFRPYLGELENSHVAQGHIRRVISRLFATDYRDFGDNDIPTGIRGLGYFERELSRDFPIYDVQVLAELARLSGLPDLHETGPLWESLLLSRGSEAQALFTATVRWIVASLTEVVTRRQPIENHDEIRFRIREILRRRTSRQHIPRRSINGQELYLNAASNASILARQLGGDNRFAEPLARLRDEYLPPARADVLLVVATEVESEAVVEVFAENGYVVTGSDFSLTNAYLSFSAVGGARVTLVRCSVGLGGPGGPELTVTEAISALRPTSIVMVGVAFGVDPSRESLGDVLLSTQVVDYGLERVGTDAKGSMVRTSRGSRPDASPRLLARFQMARLHNYGLHVKEGVVLSGPKLVDNVDYRDSLRATFPDAVGGEMEGYGVYSAASRARIDWIIAKAICDWADGQKGVRKAFRQRQAARNSALAVLRTLERGGFV